MDILQQPLGLQIGFDIRLHDFYRFLYLMCVNHISAFCGRDALCSADMAIEGILCRLLCSKDCSVAGGEFLQADRIVVPHRPECFVFLLCNVEETHHIHKLGIVLVNLRFVDFLQRGVHLVGSCGKQQHTHRGSVKELSSQHTGFRIRIGVDQILEALEFIHDNQIRLQLVQTDLGEHYSQFANDVVAIHSAVAAVLNPLAKRNQLFQISGFVFAA